MLSRSAVTPTVGPFRSLDCGVVRYIIGLGGASAAEARGVRSVEIECCEPIPWGALGLDATFGVIRGLQSPPGTLTPERHHPEACLTRRP